MRGLCGEFHFISMNQWEADKSYTDTKIWIEIHVLSIPRELPPFTVLQKGKSTLRKRILAGHPFGRTAWEICTSVTHWRNILHLEVNYHTTATFSKHWLLIRVKAEQERRYFSELMTNVSKNNRPVKIPKICILSSVFARWQDETISALIIIRTAGQTGSRISNARSDRKLFLSITFKIFPHSPTQNESVWWWWFCYPLFRNICL